MADNIFQLVEDICIFDEDTAEWKAKDIKGNSLYFSGTYAIRGGHHDNTSVNRGETAGNTTERVGW